MSEKFSSFKTGAKKCKLGMELNKKASLFKCDGVFKGLDFRRKKIEASKVGCEMIRTSEKILGKINESSTLIPVSVPIPECHSLYVP